jgi:hypothetical protein
LCGDSSRTASVGDACGNTDSPIARTGEHDAWSIAMEELIESSDVGFVSRAILRE